jgi:hypothetical protein
MHIVNLLERFPPELKGLSPEDTFKVHLDGLQVLALDEIVERLSPEQ